MKFPTSFTPSIPESPTASRQRDKHASNLHSFQGWFRNTLLDVHLSLTVVVSTKLSLSRSLTNSDTLIWLPSCPWAEETLLPPTLPACTLSLSLSPLMLPRLTTGHMLKVQLNFMGFVCSGQWKIYYSREREIMTGEKIKLRSSTWPSICQSHSNLKSLS